MVKALRNNMRKTVADCINDAYLQLDYDDTRVDPDLTPQLWNKAMRLFDPVATEIMRYRDWSFLVGFVKTHLGTTKFEDLDTESWDPEVNIDISRVIDNQGHVWNKCYNPNPGAYEYYINKDEITTGYAPNRGLHFIIIEYQEYMPMVKTGKEKIHPKLYDCFVAGLTFYLAKADQAFRDTAEEKEIAFHGTDGSSARKGILFLTALKDMRQAGDELVFGKQKTRRYLDYKKFPEGSVSPWM